MKYLKLLRINQWYKNLVIFLPLVFAGELHNVNALILTFIGFFILCLISSSNYIINDIIDKKRDKVHPEKRKRPIVSGEIKLPTAFMVSMLLLVGGFFLAFKLPTMFFYSVLGLFILSFLYNIYLKNEPFADILTIAVNFVIRAVSGALLINVRVSPWLILCTFFLSLFLSIGKRKADLDLLKDEAIKHKKTFKYYDEEMIRVLMIISTISLLMSYSLYSFLSIYNLLLISLPFAMYVILRYMHLIHKGHVIARQPENFIKDRKLTVGMVLWIFTVLLIIY